MNRPVQLFVPSFLFSARRWSVLLGLCCFLACSHPGDSETAAFTVLPTSQTGLDFNNQLKPSPAFNLFSYMYYYNGAGVGAGDFNGDGWIDLFFAANQGQNKLYLNQKSLTFKEVTAAAGIPNDSAWSTGVSVVDINADGKLDLYVCRVGQYKVLKGKNQLLVNQGNNAQGIPQFKDSAAAYGLDFSGFSTQAAFLDFDRDGDLDCFLLNHSVNHDGNYAPRENFVGTYDSLAGHRFFRNNSRPGQTQVQPFTDITQSVGINSSKIGYGLGLAVSDVNRDGWPDIYVGNDFHENDYLYINQQNGSFRELGRQQLQHTSAFSMGVDVADANNDGLPDIVSMDMLPDDPYMLRRSLAEDDYTIFQQKINFGYGYQYARNNFQLNRGKGFFSEIGQYAGIAATDWSWAALWMDFNNDGHKDLFVSNGIPKRMNDIDYINFVSGEEIQRKLRNNQLEDKDLALTQKFPEIKLANRFFLNNGQLGFGDQTNAVKGNAPGFSNGAVYADLDNDGDLDIVTNNINDPAMLYRNESRSSQHKSQKPSATSGSTSAPAKNTKSQSASTTQSNTSAAAETNPGRFLRLQLKGPASNPQGIGAQLLVYAQQETLLAEQTAVHGFLSSMIGPLQLGLGQRKIDSAVLVWPDGRCAPVPLVFDQTQTLVYQNNLPFFDFALRQKTQPQQAWPIQDLTASAGIDYQHTENLFNEFDRELLLPITHSTRGPALAVADINGDGREDFFVGGAKSYPAAVYSQLGNGKFQRMAQPDLQADSMWEANDALWLDVNADGHLDLVLATGGNEYYGNDEHQQPLLYLNNGKGHLTAQRNAFPGIYATQSRIRSLDANGDGHPDLLLTSWVQAWEYGKIPASYLLVNNGRGQFSNQTAVLAPDLLQAGMVTDLVTTDWNQDGKMDFVLSQEWGGIDLYLNQAGKFLRSTLVKEKGWWQSLAVVDYDGDGKQDLLAGNLGLNSRLHASPAQPLHLYVNDFDGNGKVEPLLTYWVKGEEIPFAGKLQLEKQMPVLKKKYLYAEAFAKARPSDLFGTALLQGGQVYTADCLAQSVWTHQQGKKDLARQDLPPALQWSSILSWQVADINGDGLKDILPGSNFHGYHVELGRMDADSGTFLLNKGKGQYQLLQWGSAFPLGQVRSILPIRVKAKTLWLFARNNDRLLLLDLVPQP